MVEAEFLHDSACSLEARIVLQVRELAKLAVEIEVEGGLVVEGGESGKCVSVFLGDLSFFNQVSDSELKHVLSVVLPHSQVVGLIWD